MKRSLYWITRFTVAIFLISTAAVWIVPVEVAQNRAIQSAGDDAYAQFEAAGEAEALWSFLRVTCPVLLLLSVVAARHCSRVVRFSQALISDFKSATTESECRAPVMSPKSIVVATLQTVICRTLIVAWLLLAVFQFGNGLWQRMQDWPVYRTNSGAQVLPNISQANRDVIRYLRQATPPGSRILVLSDQKLFFLSYYLFPRRLIHPMHPDSEFTIPLAFQQRQLAAYQLADLDPDYLKQVSPDYVLEYFESPRNVDPERTVADAQWLAFEQREHGAGYRPPYTVVLRPTQKVSPP